MNELLNAYHQKEEPKGTKDQINSSSTSHTVNIHSDWNTIKSPLQLSPIQFTGKL